MKAFRIQTFVSRAIAYAGLGLTLVAPSFFIRADEGSSREEALIEINKNLRESKFYKDLTVEQAKEIRDSKWYLCRQLNEWTFYGRDNKCFKNIEVANYDVTESLKRLFSLRSDDGSDDLVTLIEEIVAIINEYNFDPRLIEASLEEIISLLKEGPETQSLLVELIDCYRSVEDYLIENRGRLAKIIREGLKDQTDFQKWYASLEKKDFGPSYDLYKSLIEFSIDNRADGFGKSQLIRLIERDEENFIKRMVFQNSTGLSSLMSSASLLAIADLLEEFDFVPLSSILLEKEEDIAFYFRSLILAYTTKYSDNLKETTGFTAPEFLGETTIFIDDVNYAFTTIVEEKTTIVEEQTTIVEEKVSSETVSDKEN